MNLRLYSTQFVLLFSILFGVQFVTLSNGDVVNHYPYVSPDGFDWYMEGVYLVKQFGGASLPDLPVLRPPLFVFVTAADYVAGNQGLVLGIVLGLAIYFTYIFSVKIVDSVYAAGKKDAWYIVPLAIGTTIYPLNFFKPYLLSDGLAVAISLASVSFLIRFQNETKTHLLILSSILAVLAGATQTYALIPYLIACTIAVMTYIRISKKKAIQNVYLILGTSLAFIFITSVWRWIMPHGTTPQNFVLLKFSTDMFGYYLDTWGYYFFPFILFFLLYRRYQLEWDQKAMVVISSAIIVLLFAVLCIFYQWKEARFTYYFWPWLMILIFSSIRIQTKRGAYLIAILMFLHLATVPANYWAPTWQSVHIRSKHNWVGDYFSAKPVDRKLDSCGVDCSSKNDFLKHSDPYVNSTIATLNNIKGL